ncbi:MarR family winged helix-turn-helix transcriptional regulator, partial [Bacillus sp. JJ722]|uniref:MarR family winged helix-turn-helix transcriptional regulator n=1 Tax=Bacillus sp. JJ722 TaxID=3122973 RepID=UPI002FFE7B81
LIMILLSFQKEVIIINNKDFFQKLVLFTTSVHHITQELTKKAKSDDLTPVQFGILRYIYVSQPVTISQISECQCISMPNTSRELKKLIDKKLINKLEDTEDRRKQYIHLSKDGEHMMKEAFKLIEADFLHRIKDVSTEELEEIEYAMDLLQTKMFY